MTARRSSLLRDSDHSSRLRELIAENKRLRQRIVKLEVANISLKNENDAFKKHLEDRANEKLAEIIGTIMQRARGSGPAKNRRHRGLT
jgi:regulator of replication initiation timing